MQWVRGDVEEILDLERDEIVSDLKTVVLVVGNDDELARNVPEHGTNTDKQGPYSPPPSSAVSSSFNPSSNN